MDKYAQSTEEFAESLKTGKGFEPEYPCPRCETMALVEAAGPWWACTACGQIRTRFKSRMSE